MVRIAPGCAQGRFNTGVRAAAGTLPAWTNHPQGGTAGEARRQRESDQDVPEQNHAGGHAAAGQAVAPAEQHGRG